MRSGMRHRRPCPYWHIELRSAESVVRIHPSWPESLRHRLFHFWPAIVRALSFLGVSMLDELVSRLISYVGGSILVVTSIKTGDAVDAALDEGAEMVSHGGSLMRLPFANWPQLSELAGMISMGDVLGLIGAGAVLYRLWLDIRKSRGERNDNP